MAFYVLFALLALALVLAYDLPIAFAHALLCAAWLFLQRRLCAHRPIGAYCAGGSALNVSCYPVTACTVVGSPLSLPQLLLCNPTLRELAKWLRLRRGPQIAQQVRNVRRRL